MGIEDKLFSKYSLKREFGSQYLSYGTNGTRIYKAENQYIMIEPVNKNQFKVHSAYVDNFKKYLEAKIKC